MIPGIARCFTFGGSRNRVLHDPNIHPRLDLSKHQYMNKDEQTTVNHFHEKLLKLKDLMKTKVFLFFYFYFYHNPFFFNLIIIFLEDLQGFIYHFRQEREGLRKDTNSWKNSLQNSMKNGQEKLEIK